MTLYHIWLYILCCSVEVSQTLSSRTACSSKEKFLQIFINRLFCKGLYLTVPPLFIFYLFCFFVPDFCLFYLFLYLCISWFYLVFFWGGGGGGGEFWNSYMLTDCLPSNCKKNNTFEEYILTNLLRSTTTHICVCKLL